MTDDELNEEIAKLCGWKHVRCVPVPECDWLSSDIPETIIIGCPPIVGVCIVPSYSTDLNAMHEAEAQLLNTVEECYEFESHLKNLYHNGPADTCKAENHRWHANARHRAEALYLTLSSQPLT